MQALLAYKRTNSDGTFDYGFVQRSMTCFNGLNTTDAFRTVTPPRTSDMHLMLPGGDHARARYGETDQVVNNAPWIFMALGWLSEATMTKSTYTQFDASRGDYQGVEWAAQALNREHVTGRYYDWNRSQMVTGTRERTPNECELGELLSRLSNVNVGNWRSGFESCRIAWAISSRARFHYSLYDFVGSERPSGLAVAYLQVYRNCSRLLLSTDQGNRRIAAQVADIVFKFDQSMSNTTDYKSYVPLISALTNSGSDSDIFSFSTAPALALQIFKHGTFSLAEFVQDPRPMPQERKYMKGAQSSSLTTNVNAAVQRRGLTIVDAGLPRLAKMRTALATFAQYCDVSRITAYGVDTFITGIESQLAGLRLSVPDVNRVAEIVRGQLRNFVDLRRPIEPTVASPRIVGAAHSFTQWAEESAPLASAVH